MPQQPGTFRFTFSNPTRSPDGARMYRLDDAQTGKFWQSVRNTPYNATNSMLDIAALFATAIADLAPTA